MRIKSSLCLFLSFSLSLSTISRMLFHELMSICHILCNLPIVLVFSRFCRYIVGVFIYFHFIRLLICIMCVDCGAFYAWNSQFRIKSVSKITDLDTAICSNKKQQKENENGGAIKGQPSMRPNILSVCVFYLINSHIIRVSSTLTAHKHLKGQQWWCKHQNAKHFPTHRKTNRKPKNEDGTQQLNIHLMSIA